MTASDVDIKFSTRALELAARGIGLVSPNPIVGCVIVADNGKVVGEGAYIHDDVTHAEVIALEQAGASAKGGTAYVSLEPHDHHGRTPPCTEALINAGITRVVCPIEDPNPLVSGRGFDRLRSAGIDVVTGILAEEAAKHNEKFACWHKLGRPFVHLKLAASLDGRISVDRSVSTALSGDAAIRRVHEMRHEYDAILVGGNTIAVDDPKLTDRSNKPRRRPLVRVILDDRLRTAPESTIAATANQIPTLVFSNSKTAEKLIALKECEVEVIAISGRNIPAVLEELKRREIQSVLVEGGSAVAGSFVDARLVDKVTFLFSPLIVGGDRAPHAIGGTGAESLSDALRLVDVTVTKHGDDLEITGYPQN